MNQQREIAFLAYEQALKDVLSALNHALEMLRECHCGAMMRWYDKREAQS